MSVFIEKYFILAFLLSNPLNEYIFEISSEKGMGFLSSFMYTIKDGIHCHKGNYLSYGYFKQYR